MDIIKVSVIVPVYNTEQYLPRCLDSIISQTLKEIEVICVDDGSTDGSSGILDTYREKDSRILVFRQPNMHLGIARNNGLKYASGEYIIFWDSDDFFAPDALEKLYGAARVADADICVCGGYQYVEETGQILQYGGLLRGKLVPKEQPFNLFSNPRYILNFTNMAVWNKLYRRRYLTENGLCFSGIKRGEDISFTARSLCLADRISVVRDKLVYYRFMRKGGLVSGYAESAQEVLDCWIRVSAELKALNRFPEQSFANRVLASSFFLLRSIQSWTAFRDTYHYLKDSVFPQLDLTEKEPGYYYVHWQEELLCHLLGEDAEAFLITFISVMNRRLTEKETEKQILRERYRKKIRKLKEENAGIKNLLESREETIRQQRALLQEQETKTNSLGTPKVC